MALPLITPDAVGRVSRPANLPSRLLGRPQHLLVCTSLALALTAGFGLGLYMLLAFAFHLPLPMSTPALMQVHGQVQTLGFVALFIMGAGAMLFPSFHAAPLDRPRLVSAGGLIVAVGLVLRVIAQPADPALWRSVILVGAALLELGGVLLAVYAFGRVVRSNAGTRPRGSRRLLPVTMAASLLVALLLNLTASVVLAGGATVVPLAMNEALLRLEIWGFASTMVLAVAGRLYPNFLFLRPTHQHLMPRALAFWALGSLLSPAAWLLWPNEPLLRGTGMLLQVAGAALYVYALRLYEAGRVSPMPHITNPTRQWVRVAFGFLLAAGALDIALAFSEPFLGAAGITSLSAARHAVAQGFLLPIIVIMGARILPGYARHIVQRRRLLSAMIWTLFAGAALRVVAELLGGYGPGWGAAAALGGALGVAAFTVFAVGVIRTTGAAMETHYARR